MTRQSGRGGGSPRDGELAGAGRDPRPTRRGVLLGVGLAGLGGALAGCSTAAVPYDANEAGVPPAGPAPGAVPDSGPGPGSMSSSPAPARSARSSQPARKKARPKGTVLGAASDIPVGGG